MKISEFLYKTVLGPDGEPSSARVAGMLLIICGIELLIILFFSGLINQIPNLNDLSSIGYNMLLVGAGLIGYGKLNDKVGEILTSKKS